MSRIRVAERDRVGVCKFHKRGLTVSLTWLIWNAFVIQVLVANGGVRPAREVLDLVRDDEMDRRLRLQVLRLHARSHVSNYEPLRRRAREGHHMLESALA